jgi:group I intron endonuclease
MSIENKGLIYKITNIFNGKIYIGKTKKYYGNRLFGIEKRFEHHINNAISNKANRNDCPRLYNAIRKYGEYSFDIELILECDVDKCDENEIKYIQQYNSTDPKLGYNIANGGGGRSVVNVDENIRQKISKSQNDKYEMNTRPYFKDNKLVGYVARRRENGETFQKMFASQENTPETNLELAKKWLEDIKTNKKNNTLKYNRKTDLPININYIKDKYDKKTIIGYRVDVMINNKKISRSFQSKTKEKSLETLLQEALKCKASLLGNNC